MSLTNEDKDWIAGQIKAGVSAGEQRVLEAVAGAHQKTVESMRDIRTEILRGIEAFARGNFAGMHRIEVSDRTTNERIAGGLGSNF